MDYTYLDSLAELGVGGAHPGGLKLSKKLLQREKIDKEMVILDADCGTGQTSAFIKKEYGCHVIALDNHRVMTKKASQRFSTLGLDIDVKHGSTEKLPFDDGTFDLIVAESVIAFTEASATLSEFKRVLKPNGVLLAIEMMIEKPIPETAAEDICEFYQFTTLYTEREWKRLFLDTGFSKVTEDQMEPKFDPHDPEYAPDFSLSENVAPAYFEILQEHEYVMKQYQDVLKFRIFRCEKGN